SRPEVYAGLLYHLWRRRRARIHRAGIHRAGIQRARSRLLVAAGVLAVTACTRGLELIDRPDAAVITTNGPWASMVYVARTDSGVIVIDLGWTGAAEKIEDALGELGATAADVRYVFLTHAHRDHTHAWP